MHKPAMPVLRSRAMIEASDERNILYCQIVAQLLIADAAVTDAERDFLERLMNRFGFEPAQKQAVFNGVDIGQPIDDKLARLDPGSRAQLLAELEAAEGDLPRKLDPEKARALDIPVVAMSEALFRQMHASDKMAEDKLAEGIEGFSKAIVGLEKQVAERLAAMQR